MQILNIQQGSPEWHDARKLKMTASKAQAIGNSGAGLKTLILELCTDYLSSKEKENFSNSHTERGNALEDEARTVYELETRNTVLQVGFCVYDNYVGCSPDGFVGEDGLLEIKCPDDKAFLSYIYDRKIKSEYLWQMQMQMLICGRKWCDFVVYNNNFERKFFCTRIGFDESMSDKLLAGFIEGKTMIKDVLDKYNNES